MCSSAHWPLPPRVTSPPPVSHCSKVEIFTATYAQLKIQARSICAKPQVQRFKTAALLLLLTSCSLFSSARLTVGLLFICRRWANSCCSASCPLWIPAQPPGAVTSPQRESAENHFIQETWWTRFKKLWKELITLICKGTLKMFKVDISGNKDQVCTCLLPVFSCRPIILLMLPPPSQLFWNSKLQLYQENIQSENQTCNRTVTDKFTLTSFRPIQCNIRHQQLIIAAVR